MISILKPALVLCGAHTSAVKITRQIQHRKTVLPGWIRGFYDLAKAKAPIAMEAPRRIAALYELEERVRGKAAADRLAARRAESQPLVSAMRGRFEAQLAKLPARGPTAEAIRYALKHWDGLRRFLDDGRIELDSNNIERAMRPVCLSRKNSLFAGSDEGEENWACLASLIETCKLNKVDPQAYLTDLLTRLVNGWLQNRIDELMPWHWPTEGQPEPAQHPGAVEHRLRLPTISMHVDGLPVPSRYLWPCTARCLPITLKRHQNHRSLAFGATLASRSPGALNERHPTRRAGQNEPGCAPPT